MKILTSTQYKFFAARNSHSESRKAFAIIPKEMIAKNNKLKFDRAVAFGAVAERINALIDAGAELIEVAEGRFRKDKAYQNVELVCVSLPDGTTDDFKAGGRNNGKHEAAANAAAVKDNDYDDLPF